METEIIDKLFLELSQVTSARTRREIDLGTAIEKLNSSLGWYKKRCDLLRSVQSKFREPERTIVCDILANGNLLPDKTGSRYGVQRITDSDRLNLLLKFITLDQVYDNDNAPPLGPDINYEGLGEALGNEGLFKAIRSETNNLDPDTGDYVTPEKGWEKKSIIAGIDYAIREERENNHIEGTEGESD